MPTQLLEDAPIPANSAFIIPPSKNDRPGGPPPWRLSASALGYMTRLGSNMNAAPAIIQPFSAVDQNASIAPTDLSGGALSAGLYEVRYWITCVQAAGLSGSVTVTFDFTYRGVTKSATGPVGIGNSTADHESAALPMFYSDAASPILVSTLYASNPAGHLLYDLYVALLRVRA